MDSQTTEEILRTAGFRATAPRVRVLTFLQKQKYPVGAQEVAQSIQSADQVTVYRILDAFVEAGLARQVDLRQGRALYESIDTHDHHHAVCTRCHKVQDFEEAEHERILRQAARNIPGFAKITGHSFELFGICKQCA